VSQFDAVRASVPRQLAAYSRLSITLNHRRAIGGVLHFLDVPRGEATGYPGSFRRDAAPAAAVLQFVLDGGWVLAGTARILVFEPGSL